MRVVIYTLRSWALLAWDCVTVGPRAAWEPFMAARRIGKALQEKGK